MINKIVSATISGLCFITLAGLAHAEGYYSSSAQNDSGYTSTASSGENGYSSSSHSQSTQQSTLSKHRDRRFSMTIKVPGSLKWVPTSNGFIPRHAVQGGYEHNRKLYICQAQYNGGIHPGKVVGANCNIAWGGREVAIPYYNVLVS